MAPLVFKGIAHPPPKSKRDHPSDLSAGELIATRVGGLPLHVEHDTASESVGNVLASWQGARGEMRVMGTIDDVDTAARVRSGELRGLSLGTDCVTAVDGTVLNRYQKELSLCEEGRRTGTWVTHLDNHCVHEVACFSKRQGARALPSNSR